MTRIISCRVVDPSTVDNDPVEAEPTALCLPAAMLVSARTRFDQRIDVYSSKQRIPLGLVFDIRL